MSDLIERQQESEAMQKFAAIFDATNNTVSAPKIFIDMTDDFESALVLDEIFFWTKPQNGKSSPRVFKYSALWLAIPRTEWWERKRLTSRQADRAIAKLENLGFVEKRVFLYNGKPTVHLRLITQNFMPALTAHIKRIEGA